MDVDGMRAALTRAEADVAVIREKALDNRSNMSLLKLLELADIEIRIAALYQVLPR